MAHETNQGKYCVLRKAEASDAKLILEIRNDPDVRKQSCHSEYIPWETHIAWFSQQYFQKKENVCLVLECEGKRAGYCRFDAVSSDAMEISIALSPEFQGRGLGTFLLQEGLAYIADQKKEIRATVKKGNIASLGLFKEQGFELVNETPKEYILGFSRLDEFQGASEN